MKKKKSILKKVYTGTLMEQIRMLKSLRNNIDQDRVVNSSGLEKIYTLTD